jgi:hypothetical protein
MAQGTRILLIALASFGLPIALCEVSHDDKRLARNSLETEEVTFISPTEVKGKALGIYRWVAKTDTSEAPSGEGPAGYRTVSTTDISLWPDLTEKVGSDSLRMVGTNETRWFALSGTVVLVKAEDDGDLHIQLGRVQTGHRERNLDDKAQVVCEVPHGDAWNEIRKQVFSWAKVKFPCKPHKLDLQKKPTIKVIGKGFWDGEHHSDKTPNRRNYDKNVTVWEIHPVMKLEVVEPKNSPKISP